MSRVEHDTLELLLALKSIMNPAALQTINQMYLCLYTVEVHVCWYRLHTCDNHTISYGKREIEARKTALTSVTIRWSVCRLTRNNVKAISTSLKNRFVFRLNVKR